MATEYQTARENVINIQNNARLNTASLNATSQQQVADMTTNIAKLGAGAFNGYVSDKVSQYEDEETDDVKKSYLYDYDELGNPVPVSDVETVIDRANKNVDNWVDGNSSLFKSAVKSALKYKNSKRRNSYGQMLQTASYNYNMKTLEDKKNSYDGKWDFDPEERLESVIGNYETIMHISEDSEDFKYKSEVKAIRDILTNGDESDDANTSLMIAELDMLLTKDMLNMSDSWYGKYKEDNDVDTSLAISYGVYSAMNAPDVGYTDSVINASGMSKEVALASFRANIEEGLRKNPIQLADGTEKHLSDAEIKTFMSKLDSEIASKDAEWGKVVDTSVNKINEGLSTLFASPKPFETEELSRINSEDDFADLCLSYTNDEEGNPSMTADALKKTTWWKNELPVIRNFVKHNAIYNTSEQLKAFDETHKESDFVETDITDKSYQTWYSEEIMHFVEGLGEDAQYILRLMGFGDLKDTSDDELLGISRTAYASHFMTGIQQEFGTAPSVDLFDEAVSKGNTAELWKYYQDMSGFKTEAEFNDYVEKNKIDIVSDPNSAFLMSTWRTLAQSDADSRARIASSDASYAVTSYVNTNFKGDMSQLELTKVEDIVAPFKKDMDDATYHVFINTIKGQVESATLTKAQTDEYDDVVYKLDDYIANGLNNDVSNLSDTKINEIINSHDNLTESQKTKIRNAYMLKATTAKIEMSQKDAVREANFELSKMHDGDYSQLKDWEIDQILAKYRGLSTEDKKDLKASYRIKAYQAVHENEKVIKIFNFTQDVVDKRTNGNPYTTKEIEDKGKEDGIDTATIYSVASSNAQAVSEDERVTAKEKASSKIDEALVANSNLTYEEAKKIAEDAGVKDQSDLEELIGKFRESDKRNALAENAVTALIPMMTNSSANNESDFVNDIISKIGELPENTDDEKAVKQFLYKYVSAGPIFEVTDSTKGSTEDSIRSMALSYFGSDNGTAFKAYQTSQDKLNTRLVIQQQYEQNRERYVFGNLLESGEVTYSYVAGLLDLGDSEDGGKEKTPEEKIAFVLNKYFKGNEDKPVGTTIEKFKDVKIKDAIKDMTENELRMFILCSVSSSYNSPKMQAESKEFMLANGNQRILTANGTDGSTLDEMFKAELESYKKAKASATVQADAEENLINVGEASYTDPTVGASAWSQDDIELADIGSDNYINLATIFMNPDAPIDECRRLLANNTGKLTKRAYDSLNNMLSNDPNTIISGYAEGNKVLENYDFNEAIKSYGVGDVTGYSRYYSYFVENSNYFRAQIIEACKDPVDPVGKLNAVAKTAWDMYIVNSANGGEVQNNLSTTSFNYVQTLTAPLEDGVSISTLSTAWFSQYEGSLKNVMSVTPTDTDMMLLARHREEPLQGDNQRKLWDLLESGNIPDDKIAIVSMAIAMNEVLQTGTYGFKLTDATGKGKDKIEENLVVGLREQYGYSKAVGVSMSNYAKTLTILGKQIAYLKNSGIDYGELSIGTNGKITSENFGDIKFTDGKPYINCTVAGQNYMIDASIHGQAMATDNVISSLNIKSYSPVFSDRALSRENVVSDDKTKVAVRGYNEDSWRIGQKLYLVPEYYETNSPDGSDVQYEWKFYTTQELKKKCDKDGQYRNLLNSGYLPFNI